MTNYTHDVAYTNNSELHPFEQHPVDIFYFVGYNMKGDNMSLMLHIVQKEKDRIDRMLTAYERQLDVLPKGSVTIKTVGNDVYYYLKYRNGKKVLTDYLGKDGERLAEVRSALEKRRHIEAMITHLRAERALADKVLER